MTTGPVFVSSNHGTMTIQEARALAPTVTPQQLKTFLDKVEEGLTSPDVPGTYNTDITKGEALQALKSLALKDRGRKDLVHGGIVNALMEFGEFYEV